MSKKILVADDEMAILRSIKAKLIYEGFEVEGVADGEEAIKILEKQNFDLVLLDLVMPKLDGFAVLKTISEKKIKTKVVVTSNLSLEEDVAKAKELGAIGYLVKADTSLVEIVNYVKKILGIE